MNDANTMNTMPNTNKFTDPEIIAKLKELRDTDIDAFSRLIMKCLEEAPDEAVLDTAPAHKKISALNSLKTYFESLEEYENCAYIKMIEDRINKINGQ